MSECELCGVKYRSVESGLECICPACEQEMDEDAEWELKQTKEQL